MPFLYIKKTSLVRPIILYQNLDNGSIRDHNEKTLIMLHYLPVRTSIKETPSIGSIESIFKKSASFAYNAQTICVHYVGFVVGLGAPPISQKFAQQICSFTLPKDLHFLQSQ